MLNLPVPTTPYYGGGQVQNPANVISVAGIPPNNAATQGGLIGLDTTNGNAYISIKKGVWAAAGGSSGPIDTITASSGGALMPSAGNISILGTANQITTAGSGSTVTLTLPAAITAPGSLTVTSGFTVSAGTSAITGTVNVNTSGAGVTSIGTGGTGATNIGNATGNTAVTGSLTASTTLTATLGAITATNGNLVLGTAGNKIVSSSVATTIVAGANSFGTVTLVGGTATVATTAVTASSMIMLTRQTVGATGAAALGMLTIGTITAGTSFVINSWLTANATSLATTDVSNIGWMIIN